MKQETISVVIGDSIIMNKRIILRSVAWFVICLTILSIGVPAFAAEQAVSEAKTVEKAKLLAGQGEEYETLLTVKKGTKVTVLDAASNADWVRVVTSGKEGFIARKSLDLPAFTPTADENAAGTAAYAVRSTKMRETNSANGKVLYTLSKNTAVTMLKTEGSRYQISYNGKTGYTDKSDIALGTPAADKNTASTGQAAASADVNAAKIAQAKAVNADTVGWVQIPNTNIDDVILYAPNFYYANRDINKKKSVDSVYPYSNKKSKNIVVFGHNLRGSNNCFHQLHHLEEAARGVEKCQHANCGRSLTNLTGWHLTKEGRTFNISIFGFQKWEVFAMYEVKKNEPISTLRNNWALNPSNMDKWIEGQLTRSKSYMGMDFGVGVSGKDQILTLITCGTEYDSATANSRLFVFLKNVD